jgi:hypothetical protein
MRMKYQPNPARLIPSGAPHFRVHRSQGVGHVMSLIDDDTATAEELSEELIFLIAAVSTDAQRKRAIELFRRFARLTAEEAYRNGCESVKPPAPTSTEPRADPSAQRQPQQEKPLIPDRRVSLVPEVSWED